MANMSYCRFHNTRIDMEDCIEALNMAQWEGEPISKSEIEQCKYMFEMIYDYLCSENIIDKYESYKPFEEWKSNLDNYCED